MKKIYVVFAFTASVLVLANCNPSKGVTTDVPKTTYEGDLSPVIISNCSPCHIPSKGGNKKAYDNYANVRTDIDEMIRRIELQPDEKGFMPFRKKERLPDSIIHIFKKFRDDGTLEK